MNRADKLDSALAAVIAFSTFLWPGGPVLAETVEINDIEMYYEIIGEGEPLILLHGALLHTGDTWKNVADDFAKNFQVIVPDLRGHAATANPSGDYYAEKQLALDVFALLKHLEIETVRAMGISMGAVTLLHMATQQPDRIKSMVLIGAANYFTEDDRELARNLDTQNIPADQMRQWREVHKHGDEQITAMILNNKIGLDDYESTAFTPPYLSTIKADTLIVHGERDRRVPINIALEMYEAIANSFLWIVPNGGHVPIREFYKENLIVVAEAFLSGQMIPGRSKNIN